jgi:hypothetical protein
MASQSVLITTEGCNLFSRSTEITLKFKFKCREKVVHLLGASSERQSKYNKSDVICMCNMNSTFPYSSKENKAENGMDGRTIECSVDLIPSHEISEPYSMIIL